MVGTGGVARGMLSADGDRGGRVKEWALICDHCAAQFVARQPNGKFCSPSCATLSYRARKRISYSPTHARRPARIFDEVVVQRLIQGKDPGRMASWSEIKAYFMLADQYGIGREAQGRALRVSVESLWNMTHRIKRLPLVDLVCAEWVESPYTDFQELAQRAIAERVAQDECSE
jgi:hypothetical protein